MKPYVTIDLAPHLQDYLYHEFPEGEDGGVLISATNDMGKFATAMISVTDRPPRTIDMENPINLYLPIQAWNHAILEENFLYIPEWKHRMLQNYIDSSFRLRIREYFLHGYEKGFKQDKIILAFLRAYSIKNNAINYETIKKYDYRNRQKIIKEVHNEIQLAIQF